MPIQKLKRKAMWINGMRLTDQADQFRSRPMEPRRYEEPEVLDEGLPTLNEFMEAFRRTGVSVRQAGSSLIKIGGLLRAHCATERHGPAWLRAHPGRRLPGGMSNRRMAKKRAQYLERWAREEGLA